jgi:hypothetical protein
MYSNPKKAYYTSLSSSGSGSVFGSAFINEAIVLLRYYNSNNIALWNTEFNSGYAQLKLISTNYKNDKTAYTVSQLIDNLNASIIVANDLRNQINTLQQELVEEKVETTNIFLGAGTIEQNVQLNKVYIQYMLLYSLMATNGVFIPSKLDEAQALLDENGGQITVPTI